MKSTRRDFLATTGLTATGLMAASLLRGATPSSGPGSSRRQLFNMCGYGAPKLDKVRVGLVGIGSRGGSAIPRLKAVEGVEIRALCDVRPARVAEGLRRLGNLPYKPATFSDREDAWKQMCARD